MDNSVQIALVIAVIGAVASLATLMVMVIRGGRWTGTIDARADDIERTVREGMREIKERLDSHSKRLDLHHEQITLLRGIEEGRRIERERRERE